MRPSVSLKRPGESAIAQLSALSISDVARWRAPREPTSACNTVGSKYMPSIWAHLGRRLSWSPGPQATSRRPSSANGQIAWSRRTSLGMVQFEVLRRALPNHAVLSALVVLWSVTVPASDFSPWLVAVPTSVGGG